MKPEEKTRDELIAENDGLVRRAVGAFIEENRQFAYLRDDLYSGGLIRLIDSIDRFLAGEVDNLAAYLRLTIWSGLWEVVRSENVIQSPRHCPARRVMPSEEKQYQATDFGWLASVDELPEQGLMSSENVRAMADCCCRDETDKMVLSMLVSRKTLRAIAKELEISLTSVGYRKRKMGQRLREMMESE